MKKMPKQLSCSFPSDRTHSNAKICDDRRAWLKWMLLI